MDYSNGGRYPTPIQKYVYAKAKDYWTDKKRSKAKRKAERNSTQQQMGRGI